MVRVTLENMLDAYTAADTCSLQYVTPRSNENHTHRKHAEQRKKALPSEIASGNNCGALQAFIEMKYSGLNLDMVSAPVTAAPLSPSLALFVPGLLSLL